MAIGIEGNAGEAFGAKVDSFNRLWTNAVSSSVEEDSADNGRGFIIHFECHTALAASGGLMSIQNDDQNNDIVITRIYIDPQTITPTDLLITQVKNPTLTGGTSQPTSIINKTYDSGTVLDATVKVSDSSADLTFSGGDRYHVFPIASRTSTQRDMKGTNVITSGKNVLFGWETEGGGNATDGEIISLSVNCYKRARLT